MNLWQRTLTRIAALVRPSAPVTSRIAVVRRTTSGEVVDEDTALRQSVVWACLAFLSRSVGQLPWRVMAPADLGSVEQRTHPVHRLLRVRPNAEMGPFKFKETMVWWAASWGNAVAEIQRDARGVPVALLPIHPSRIAFDRDDAGALRYVVWNDAGAPTVLRAADVFHLAGFGDGAVGLSVIAYAAESIGWARAVEVFGAAYFGQGMAPSGVVTTKAKLTPDGKQELQNEITSKFSGAKNAHRTLVLDVDMDYKPLAAQPASMQLVETRQHQVEEICRWFGVPPHKVMHLLRATFSNIEHQSIEVVVDAITPWCLRLEEEADYKLFGANNRQGVYTKLDLKGLLRGAYKDRQEGLQIMRRNGIINGDEWRALEDMNPLPGDLGKKYIVEGNMTTLDRVGEQPDPAAPPPADPAADPEDDQPPLLRQARQQLHRSVH